MPYVKKEKRNKTDIKEFIVAHIIHIPQLWDLQHVALEETIHSFQSLAKVAR